MVALGLCADIFLEAELCFSMFFFLSELKIGSVEIWEPDFRYWKALGDQALGCSSPWILPCPVLHLVQVLWEMQGCSFPAVKVKHLPAQNIQEKIIWDLSLEELGDPDRRIAVVVSQPKIYWCLGRIISLSPPSARPCFYLHCQVVAARRVGALAHIPAVTRVMGTSHSLIQNKSSGISCLGFLLLLFCWNHWWLLWKSVRMNSIAGSFWPEQEFNHFL